MLADLLIVTIVFFLLMQLALSLPMALALFISVQFLAVSVLLELAWKFLTRQKVQYKKANVRGLIRSLYSFAMIIVPLLLLKGIWASFFLFSGERLLLGDEKTNLMERRAWLLQNVAVPEFSLSQMPSLFPKVSKQEFAIGSLSMASAALANLAFQYPETQKESLAAVETMISRMLKDDIESFETAYWGEDALSTLAGDKGHAGYLGHLNLMLGIYRYLGGDSRFNPLHKSISETLSRRISNSPHRYIETFPGMIFIPDTAVVVASIAVAHAVDPDISDLSVRQWVEYTKAHLLDPQTGIIKPWIDVNGEPFGPPRGSYAAWTNFYLNWIDKDFSRNQYRLLKAYFADGLPFGAAGLREYLPGYPGIGDFDSGPVIFGLSTSGTGFMVSGARLNKDSPYLEGLLKTAEFVGSTARINGTQRYLLAPVVGDAIMLAMMTACDWDKRFMPDEREIPRPAEANL